MRRSDESPKTLEPRELVRQLLVALLEILVESDEDLRPCSPDDFVSLGLRVANGRATLESLNDAPTALPRDRCVVDIVSRLRFAKSDDLIAGVVGVKLPNIPESDTVGHVQLRGKR